MEGLKFHTQELPQMEEAGARYIVVAYYDEWRDGLATNNLAEVPKLQRQLRKRFMNRLDSGPGAACKPHSTLRSSMS